MITLYLLKRNGKIKSYLPTQFFITRSDNHGASFSKDMETLTILNKNYK